jgi:hypothetical protein
MIQHYLNERRQLMALGGLFCIAPAFIFCSIGILVVVFGLRQANEALDGLISRVPIFQVVIHPLVIFGGLLLALILNAPAVAKARIDRAIGDMTITFSTKGRLFNILVLVSCILFTLAVLLYAIAENFIIISR